MVRTRSGLSTSFNMSNRAYDAFREEHSQAIKDSEQLFPGDANASIRTEFLTQKRQELLRKYGFLADASNNSSNKSEKASIIRDFASTTNKFDSRSESMTEFFDRFERKLEIDEVPNEYRVDILQILLPTHYYVPFEDDKNSDEQYTLYKTRSLVKAKCTPIDILYRIANFNVKAEDTFEQVFSNVRNKISKCLNEFEDELDTMTWIFILRSFPKRIRMQLAEDCRPAKIEDLQCFINRFVGNRNNTIVALLADVNSVAA